MKGKTRGEWKMLVSMFHVFSLYFRVSVSHSASSILPLGCFWMQQMWPMGPEFGVFFATSGGVSVSNFWGVVSVRVAFGGCNRCECGKTDRLITRLKMNRFERYIGWIMMYHCNVERRSWFLVKVNDVPKEISNKKWHKGFLGIGSTTTKQKWLHGNP